MVQETYTEAFGIESRTDAAGFNPRDPKNGRGFLSTPWRRRAKKQIVDDEEGICNVNYPITRGIAGFHGAGRRRAKKEIVYQKQSVSDID